MTFQITNMLNKLKKTMNFSASMICFIFTCSSANEMKKSLPVNLRKRATGLKSQSTARSSPVTSSPTYSDAKYVKIAIFQLWSLIMIFPFIAILH